MVDLFTSPTLLIVQPDRTLNYQITDPQGAPLGYAALVGGGAEEKKGMFSRFFGSGEDRSVRTVLQMSRPDGAPLFFLDRAARMTQSVSLPPCSVVAPDGTLIGRVEHNTAAFAQSYLATGGRGIQQSYRLVDATGRPLCDVVAEPKFARTHHHTDLDGNNDYSTHMAGGRFATYTDMNGVQIATTDLSQSGSITDRFVLQLTYQLPDPLRTLVIASPIAIDLM
jgi:hypothetical protein